MRLRDPRLLLVVSAASRSMTSDGCFTTTDASPVAVSGGVFLTLTFSFTDAGTAFIGSVVTTWTPMP